MSATLRLRLEKYLDGRGTRDGLIANVYGLDARGQRDHARDRRDLIIPAGPGNDALAVPVEPGDYVVQATLPSGDVTSDQVSVAAGEEREVALRGPQSPNEWLSWQQFIGNVPALPDLPEAKPSRRKLPATQIERIDAFVRDHVAAPTSRPGAAGGVLAGGGRRSMRMGGAGGGRCGAAAPGRGRPTRAARPRQTRPVVEAPSWPAIWFVGQPVEALAGHRAGRDAWAVLGGEIDARNPLATLSAGPATRADQYLEQAEYRRYAFGAEGPTAPGGGAYGGGPGLPRRYVVSIRARGPVEVACLPVPWPTLNGPTPVELLVRHQPKPGEAVLAMSPDDPVVRSAIGYMAAGSLSNARLMFENARDLLFGKMLNPLAAAAGGYVLLATQQGSGAEPWHPWTRNLANWFDWLPDGMIQYGRLRLLRRTGEADVTAAREAFFAAYDRGIPFYSLGLQWLVDGLSLLATGDDQEARDRLKAVQQVTWRANLQQPFTTLRLRDR